MRPVGGSLMIDGWKYRHKSLRLSHDIPSIVGEHLALKITYFRTLRV